MGYDMYIIEKDLEAEEKKNKLSADFNEAVKARDAFERDAPEYKQAQSDVHQLYMMMESADINYFRLNIGGMSICREVMLDLGMAYESLTPEKEWKKPNDFNPQLNYDLIDLYEYPEEGKEIDKPAGYDEWMAYRNEKLSMAMPAEGQTANGLPLHKFGSNDGWRVTPDECRDAVRIYEEILARKAKDGGLLGNDTPPGIVAVMVAMTKASIIRANRYSRPDSGSDVEQQLVDHAYSNYLLTKGTHWFCKWIEFLRFAADHGGFKVH